MSEASGVTIVSGRDVGEAWEALTRRQKDASWYGSVLATYARTYGGILSGLCEDDPRAVALGKQIRDAVEIVRQGRWLLWKHTTDVTFPKWLEYLRKDLFDPLPDPDRAAIEDLGIAVTATFYKDDPQAMARCEAVLSECRTRSDALGVAAVSIAAIKTHLDLFDDATLRALIAGEAAVLPLDMPTGPDAVACAGKLLRERMENQAESDMARPRSADLLEELAASVYASLNASIRGEPQPVPATIEEWVRLRAGSAWVQTHGGHPLESVWAFLRDTDGFPESLGPPPPDLQARLLFAYAFLTATDGDPNKLEAPPTPERKNQ